MPVLEVQLEHLHVPSMIQAMRKQISIPIGNGQARSQCWERQDTRSASLLPCVAVDVKRPQGT